MSGFEMHRFRTIDRALTQDEMNEIDSWSSRFSPTSMGVTYIYHYGSFKKSIGIVFPKYFDAMLYVDSWGTRQLMFRFPKKLVKWDELQDFTNIFEETSLDFRKKGDFIIMDLVWHNEDGGDWMEEEDYLLDPLLSLRNDILNGDYRTLFLGWLMVHEKRHELHHSKEGDYADFLNDFLDEFEEDELVTPPIPPNLKGLNAAHNYMMEVFDIDNDFVTAAAMKSKSKTQKKKEYQSLLQKLSEKEKDDFLIRLINKESNLDVVLMKKLDSFDKNATSIDDNRISWEDLYNNLKVAEAATSSRK